MSRTGPGAGNRTTVGRTGGGDVYAGHDGNVYQRTDTGWQQSNGSGGWNGVGNAEPRNTNAGAQTSQLDRDSAARSTGNDRTTSRSSWESSGSTRSGASSYSGGGASRSRSGGGRRR